MTLEQAQEIDDSLAAIGVRYDTGDELFRRELLVVEWDEILAALPHLSLNDLAAYVAARHEARRGAVNIQPGIEELPGRAG